MNTASKNEINVEAPLPLIPGRLLPWKRGGSLSVGSIAKFRPAESDPLTRWIPEMQFRVKSGSVVKTVLVERFLEAKHVAGDRVSVYRRGRYETQLVPARTIPAVVVVRVLSFEVVR